MHARGEGMFGGIDNVFSDSTISNTDTTPCRLYRYVGAIELECRFRIPEILSPSLCGYKCRLMYMYFSYAFPHDCRDVMYPETLDHAQLSWE